MIKTIKFLEYRFIGYIVTSLMFIVFIGGTIMHGGFNWGIDFVGGAKIIAKFDKSTNARMIRDSLEKQNIKAEVQQYGKEQENTYTISAKLSKKKDNKIGLADKEQQKNNAPASLTNVKPQPVRKDFEKLEQALSSSFPAMIILNREEVGPAIGDYLKASAVKLIIACVLLMGLYLAFRFEWRYSVGAMIGICHDVLLSFFYCGLMNIEINIPIVAGILTIFGYSINDTIIVYDRIRENKTIMAKEAFTEIVDRSITQVIKRTIMTTVTALLAILCLYIIGEDIINDFAIILFFGFSVGVFSTIAVSAPVVYALERITTK